jgi:nucleoid-associated protein YgaU
MPNRYQYLKKRFSKDTTGRKTVSKEVLKTQIIPQIDTNNGDIFILSKIGDRLDRLAYLYYEDASLWWFIAKANNIGKGTWAVAPGTVLRIPAKVDSEFALLGELQKYNEQYR